MRARATTSRRPSTCRRRRAIATPAELKPVGETAYVAGVTEPLQHGPVAVAKGIVGHADLRLGERVREVLEAHLEAGRGRFRGCVT